MNKKPNNIVKIKADDSLNAYIRKVNAIPILTLEEEQTLTSKLWQDINFSAAHKLVLSHLKLVVKIAQNFKSYNLPMKDIISEGNIGLMKAVQKFSPAVGCRLSTYATWWIRAAIQEYILNNWSMLKISSTQIKKKFFYNLKKTRECLYKLVGVDDDSIGYLQPVSLDEVSLSGSNLLSQIESPDSNHDEKIIGFHEHNDRLERVKDGITKLTIREKDILYRRLLKQIPDKLSILAAEYSISKERVRQIETTIIKKLQKFAIV